MFWGRRSESGSKGGRVRGRRDDQGVEEGGLVESAWSL